MKIIRFVFIVLVLCSVSVPRFTSAISFRFLPPLRVQKFQITSDPHQENSPNIYQDWVVYSDWGGDGVSLRLYNIRTHEDALLLEKLGHALNGDIYGKTVVVGDHDGVQSDIYGIDLRTHKEFPIAMLPDSNQSDPAIFNHLVVWSDNRNGNYDIYGYSLITRVEFQITNDTLSNHAPRIWGTKVVWYTAIGGGLYSIEGYDIAIKEKFVISSTNYGFQQTPDIFAHHIVWVGSEDGNIYYKNLATGKEKALTTTGGKSWPRVSQRYVTWVDSEGVGAHNIYAYDLYLGRTVQISDDGAQQISPTIPDIWNDTIVWMSWHTGNGDVYGARVR